MSQSDLADGVADPSYVSMLEAGKRTPSLEIVIQLADRLGVAVEDLTGVDAMPHSIDTERENQYLAMQVRASSAMDLGDLDDACRWTMRSFELATAEGNPHRMLSAGLSLQGLLALVGESAKRYALLERLSELATMRIPDVYFKITLSRADAAWDTGRMREAETLVRAALDGVADADLTGTTAHVRAMGMLVVLRADLGEFWDQDALIDAMMAAASAGGGSRSAGWAYWSAAAALALAGSGESALRHLSSAEELADDFLLFNERAWFYRSAASIQLSAGADLGRVRDNLDRAEGSLRSRYIRGQHFRLDAQWARFDLADGRPAEAAERCAKLLAGVEDLALTAIERARLHAVYARALAALGDVADAVVQYRSAANAFEEFTAYAWSARTLRELDELRSAA